jgi:YfiH family protein
MHFVEIQGRRYAQWDELRRASGLRHAFSTRPMNIAPRNGADAAHRAAQRRTMVADWGLEPARLCYCQQVHETRLAVAEDECASGPLTACDGVVTAEAGRPLMTFSADCPLVLVWDPVRRVLGLVHASWRCTVARLTGGLVELMGARFGCRGADLQAGIGPSAGPCCYQVQQDVYQAARELPGREQCFLRRGGRLYFDLWEASRIQLLAAGVPADRIDSAATCTLCHNDVFYSYRREGPGCGHFGLLAALTAACN